MFSETLGEIMSVAEPTTEWELLDRVIQADHSEWPIALAEAILRMEFSERDRTQLHDLLIKNQSDALTPIEQRSLESYRNVSLLFDLLRAKARLVIKKAQETA